VRDVRICVKEGGHRELRMARVMMAAARMTATKMTSVQIASHLGPAKTMPSPRRWKVDLHIRRSDASTVDGGLLTS